MIKQSLVGRGAADKTQVQHMVRLLLNLPEAKLQADAADALAVALTHAHMSATALRARGVDAPRKPDARRRTRMIGRLKGILVHKQPPWLVVDVNGVGYELEAPMSTFYDLPEVGREVVAVHPLRAEGRQRLAVRLPARGRAPPVPRRAEGHRHRREDRAGGAVGRAASTSSRGWCRPATSPR